MGLSFHVLVPSATLYCQISYTTPLSQHWLADDYTDFDVNRTLCFTMSTETPTGKLFEVYNIRKIKRKCGHPIYMFQQVLVHSEGTFLEVIEQGETKYVLYGLENPVQLHYFIDHF